MTEIIQQISIGQNPKVPTKNQPVHAAGFALCVLDKKINIIYEDGRKGSWDKYFIILW